MPSDSSQQGGRRHFHRGRRGYERRGGDRRNAPPSPQNQPPDRTAGGDHVDVEQIMREIRSKIAQRHGVELTDQQVQELAARRLESILDPRTIKPSLIEQLRRSAGARPDSVAAADRAGVPFEFEDTTLYDSPSGLTRFIRKLLNPILKLFFNPNPLIRALHIQSQLNAEAAKRDAERDQRQAEWNALHYEILHRVVTESAKVSLEVQNLSLKVEALAAKVDFNDRRVRSIEGVAHQPRLGGGRDREREREVTPIVPPATLPVSEAAATPSPGGSPEAPTGDVPRRRRRRRRGRRGGGTGEAVAAPVTAPRPELPATVESFEGEEIDEGEGEFDAIDSSEIVTTGIEAIDQIEAADAAPVADIAPERVTPQLTTIEPDAREEIAPSVPVPAPSPEAKPDEPQ